MRLMETKLANPAPLGDVVINEVLAHTDPPAFDAIELYNHTTTNVSVGGWYLTDDPGFPWKYRISTTVCGKVRGKVCQNSRLECVPIVGASI